MYILSTKSVMTDTTVDGNGLGKTPAIITEGNGGIRYSTTAAATVTAGDRETGHNKDNGKEEQLLS